MDEFVNTIEYKKFSSTNGPWNNLRLNDPWSVGYVSALIELEPFQSKEEWEEYYYQTGEERNRVIATFDKGTVDLLNNESLVLVDPSKAKKLDGQYGNINTQKGRTKEQFANKGKILFDHVVQSGVRISHDECIECVRFRVICETWNGIIIREHNTINELKKLFKEVDFRKVPGNFDYQYAVDYELYFLDILVGAIQIKPGSYLWNADYIQKARYANKKKNEEYFNKFGKKVFDVISTNKGIIKNFDIIDQIKKELSFIGK